MLSTFLTLIKDLDDEHKKCLLWFQNNKGKIINGWPKKIDDKYYLATKAKGIYKPKETKYALSLRSSLKSDYKDILELKENGKFKFKYFQENIDIRKRDFEFTNRAVKECINDVIPVGIFIQISPKPKTSYKIIGTGIVKKWENGFFLINGFDKNGDI